MTALDRLALYRAVHQIAGPVARHSWPFIVDAVPSNGVYLVYEEGELFEGRPRIVRIGTHRAQDGLRRRLRYHVGGNKNSSIFRKHLGSAVLKRLGYAGEEIARWMRQDTRGWRDVEKTITVELETRFTFSCLRIDNTSERMGMERRLIASLTCLDYSPASDQWIGNLAWSPVVRSCGMWNSQHVADSDRLDEGGLRELGVLVETSLRWSG